MSKLQAVCTCDCKNLWEVEIYKINSFTEGHKFQSLLSQLIRYRRSLTLWHFDEKQLLNISNANQVFSPLLYQYIMKMYKVGGGGGGGSNKLQTLHQEMANSHLYQWAYIVITF